MLLDPLAEPESDSGEDTEEDSVCDVVVSDTGGSSEVGGGNVRDPGLLK